MSTIYEAIPTLPPLAVTIATVCIFVMLAGMAVWLAAKVIVASYEHFASVHMALLEAETKLAKVKSQTDAEAVNIWIHKYYIERKRAEKENHRADQEAYSRRQIAQGRAKLEGGKA